MTGKKHSAKPGVRARKRRVAPPNPARRGEIVDEIMDHLRPLKDRKGVAAVTATVNEALLGHIEFALHQASHSTRPQVRKHAKQLDSALMKLDMLLGSAPKQLIWSLYHPVTSVKTMPQRAEDIERAIRKRAEDFAAELKQMRQACARAEDLGDHPNNDNAKRMCAWGAHSLMVEFSSKKISGTADSAFRVITSLLYEVITGQKDAELKRACDSVLRDLRGENQVHM